MALQLTSSAFPHEGDIPVEYTGDGDDVSPPLSWSGVPEGTESLALIVDDPDAPDPANPQRTWVHWVLYNVPASASGLERGAADGGLPDGARQGLNDWKRTGYGGPAPPIGRHRYFHKLYVLDTVLPDLGEPSKDELLEAMEGHVLASTELIGTFAR